MLMRFNIMRSCSYELLWVNIDKSSVIFDDLCMVGIIFMNSYISLENDAICVYATLRPLRDDEVKV